MPVITPITRDVVNEVLAVAKSGRQKKELKQILDESGLGIEDIANTISEVMVGGENSNVRLSAAKTASQLHGLLDSDNIKQIPIVNIIIKDTRIDSINGINPILIPRSFNLEPSLDSNSSA